jgi:hypothetical protein
LTIQYRTDKFGEVLNKIKNKEPSMFGRGLKTPKGMGITAQAGDLAQPDKLPLSHGNMLVKEASETTRKYACGHEGPEWYVLDVYGQETVKIEKKDLCPECKMADYKKYVIRCAACGLPIAPDQSVALYANNTEFFDQSIVTKVGDSVIGCMRWNCCPSGGFYAGNWTEEGFKSAFDGDTAAEQAATS